MLPVHGRNRLECCVQMKGIGDGVTCRYEEQVMVLSVAEGTGDDVTLKG